MQLVHPIDEGLLGTLSHNMSKKYFILMALYAICFSANAQRFTFNEFLSLVRLTVDDPSYPIMGINDFLTKNSTNWKKPSKKEVNGELSITWPYLTNGNEMGHFTATFKPQELPNGNTSYLQKATFAFSSKAQYNEYLQTVSSNAKLVNSFIRSGCTYKVYESSKYTWAFILIPASTKVFFLNGVPTEAYQLEVHQIL